MVNLIKSCIPSIVYPRAIPMSDFDSILIAIKMASMGNNTDVDTTCPSCKEENNFTADLGRLLSSIKQPDYDKAFTINDLTIYFKPLNYNQVSENSLWQVEQQQTINRISVDPNSTDAEKSAKLNEVWLEITRATINIVAMNIDTIKTTDAVVRDNNQIREFLHNCPQDLYTAIKDQVTAIKDQSALQPLHITCSDCKHEYDQPFVLDQSNFFD
jgi:hypothetical protein